MNWIIENKEWFFSGIGTCILSGLVGLLVGGFAGYKIGIHNRVNVKQKQKSGNNSNQTQIGNTTNYGTK